MIDNNMALIVQTFIKMTHPSARVCLNSFIINNIENFAIDKYGILLVKALINSNPTKLMIREIFIKVNNSKIIQELCMNTYGNYLIQELILLCCVDFVESRIFAVITRIILVVAGGLLLLLWRRW